MLLNLILSHKFKFSLCDLVYLSELKRESRYRAASLIDRFAVSVASVRRGYGLQIVCLGMIYEQHRTTADYNGNSLRNWPDKKIIVRRTKNALIRATVSFFSPSFFFIFRNILFEAVTDAFSGVLIKSMEEAIA